MYRNELDKVCFAHDAAYSGLTGLTKRNISDKNLKNRVHEISRNHGYDGYQGALVSMVSISFLIRKHDRERERQAKWERV